MLQRHLAAPPAEGFAGGPPASVPMDVGLNAVWDTRYADAVRFPE